MRNSETRKNGRRKERGVYAKKSTVRAIEISNEEYITNNIRATVGKV